MMITISLSRTTTRKWQIPLHPVDTINKCHDRNPKRSKRPSLSRYWPTRNVDKQSDERYFFVGRSTFGWSRLSIPSGFTDPWRRFQSDLQWFTVWWTIDYRFVSLFSRSDRLNWVFVLAYPCAWRKDVFMHGRLFLSVNYLCFYTCFFKWEESVGLRSSSFIDVRHVPVCFSYALLTKISLVWRERNQWKSFRMQLNYARQLTSNTFSPVSFRENVSSSLFFVFGKMPCWNRWARLVVENDCQAIRSSPWTINNYERLSMPINRRQKDRPAIVKNQ